MNARSTDNVTSNVTSKVTDNATSRVTSGSSRKPAITKMWALGGIALSLVAALAAGAALAGSCRIFLAIGEAEARPAGEQAVLDMVGVWEFDNVLQVALGLDLAVIVTQGDNFVRYPFGAGAESGQLPTGTDGENLTISDLIAIKTSGTVDPEAEILVFTPHHMQLSLPQLIQAGAVTVRMYLVRDSNINTTFFSNVVTTQLKTS
ncbi:MAG: hypothetical protein ACI91F_003460, partial [Candidatus Binatia bacterium]